MNADLTFDIRDRFPLEDDSFDKVYLFHCIEHIERWRHNFVLREIHRVLRLGGEFFISYPEFETILRNWLSDEGHDRKFWEATVYGRQSYPGDYHYCGISTLDMRETLRVLGFDVTKWGPEPQFSYNSYIHAKKIPAPPFREDLVKECSKVILV